MIQNNPTPAEYEAAEEIRALRAQVDELLLQLAQARAQVDALNLEKASRNPYLAISGRAICRDAGAHAFGPWSENVFSGQQHRSCALCGTQERR